MSRAQCARRDRGAGRACSTAARPTCGPHSSPASRSSAFASTVTRGPTEGPALRAPRVSSKRSEAIKLAVSAQWGRVPSRQRPHLKSHAHRAIEALSHHTRDNLNVPFALLETTSIRTGPPRAFPAQRAFGLHRDWAVALDALPGPSPTCPGPRHNPNASRAVQGSTPSHHPQFAARVATVRIGPGPTKLPCKSWARPRCSPPAWLPSFSPRWPLTPAPKFSHRVAPTFTL